MATGLESIAPMSINRLAHKFAFNTYDTFVYSNSPWFIK